MTTAPRALLSPSRDAAAGGHSVCRSSIGSMRSSPAVPSSEPCAVFSASSSVITGLSTLRYLPRLPRHSVIRFPWVTRLLGLPMLLPMTGSSCTGEGSTGADNPGADAGDVPSGSSGVDGLEPEVNLFAQGRAFVLARHQQLLPCPSLDHLEDGLVDMFGTAARSPDVHTRPQHAH